MAFSVKLFGTPIYKKGVPDSFKNVFIIAIQLFTSDHERLLSK